MTRQQNISVSISSLIISLLLLIPTETSAQWRKRAVVHEKDTTAFFKGLAVSADLLGPGMQILGDYGQYEAALRVNLRDRYFPIVELGLGVTDHVDDGTQTSYKTSAPYGKIGVDFNMMKNKHDIYRLYGGVRYAYTNFKYDLHNPEVTDPVWGDKVNYDVHDVKCNYHWVELVFGVDATIWGPFHLGWSVRYRNRISCNEGMLGRCWYVPGFGKSGKSALGGTVNVIFELGRK